MIRRAKEIRDKKLQGMWQPVQEVPNDKAYFIHVCGNKVYEAGLIRSDVRMQKEGTVE